MNNIPSPGTYMEIHKQAFRIAFDFLNDHFPPENDDEWWKKTADDMTLIGNMYGENRCVVHLMTGVFEYLSDENERRKKNGTADH
jgi:hypothetical protein